MTDLGVCVRLCMLSFCDSFVANGSILDTDEKTWDFSFNLNVKSMYRMCRAIIPKVGAGQL